MTSWQLGPTQGRPPDLERRWAWTWNSETTPSQGNLQTTDSWSDHSAPDRWSHTSLFLFFLHGLFSYPCFCPNLKVTFSHPISLDLTSLSSYSIFSLTVHFSNNHICRLFFKISMYFLLLTFYFLYYKLSCGICQLLLKSLSLSKVELL